MDEEQKELTQEEIAKRKAEMLEYMTAETPFLTAQLAYEMLITQIEEARLRQLFAQVKMAEIKAPPPDQVETKERKLRKE